MIFGELQKSSAAAHRRRSMATTSALTDYEADLTSKDRLKQKEAIRRILAGKVKEDWEWTWPQEDDDRPKTPVIERSQEDPPAQDWTERDEWESNVSENEDDDLAASKPLTAVNGEESKDPFRFDSPDGVGDTVRQTAKDRKARRRRKLEEEIRTNDGLRCFTHRRNAWTGARHVRHTHPHSQSRSSTATSLSRHTSQSSSSTQVQPQLSSPLAGPDQRIDEEDGDGEWTTEIPIPPPILPPQTPMRRNITSRAHTTIYEKVILQSQTPFCPINLATVTRCCVEGWKRDGEWPPKGTEMDGVIAGVKRTNIGELGLAKDNTGTGRGSTGWSGTGMGRSGTGTGEGGGEGVGKGRSVIRRSIQKVMGAVRERAGSKGSKDGDTLIV